MKKKFLLTLCVWSLFVVTRLVIWVYRPVTFTEIIYSYMPYAHLWAGGTKPYLQQWYEYPPATIPLFYLPHVIDMATNHHWYHLNYLISYRGSLLLIDIVLFWLMSKVLQKSKVPPIMYVMSLGYYALVTAKANHFIYDSMDLTFTFSMFVAAIAPILWKRRGWFVGWLGYFLAVALKYVNAPLGLMYAAFERKNIRKLVIELLITGLLIWGLPLALFRSSLLVSFVYHQQRGLQVESVPATITSTINRFTHTEHFAEVYKNYDIQGPVSIQVKRVFDILFPISLLIFGIWSTFRIFHCKEKDADKLRLWVTLGYITLFMLTAKVLSTPFLLWHIPFIVVLPITSLKQKVPMMLASAAVIVASMTSIPDLPIGIFSIHLLIGWIRVIAFGYLFIRSVKAIQTV